MDDTQWVTFMAVLVYVPPLGSVSRVSVSTSITQHPPTQVFSQCPNNPKMKLDCRKLS